MLSLGNKECPVMYAPASATKPLLMLLERDSGICIPNKTVTHGVN